MKETIITVEKDGTIETYRCNSFYLAMENENGISMTGKTPRHFLATIYAHLTSMVSAVFAPGDEEQ